MGCCYSDKSNVKKPSLDSSKDKTNASNIKLKKLGITASGNAEEAKHKERLEFQAGMLSPIKEEHESYEVDSPFKLRLENAESKGKKKHKDHDKIKHRHYNSSSLESSLSSKDKYSVEESGEVDEHYEESNHT